MSIGYTMLSGSNLPFLISDIRALLPSRQSAQISEIKNGRLDPGGSEYLKCNHLTPLHFKELNGSATYNGHAASDRHLHNCPGLPKCNL